ncbi:MAG: Coenzyme F420 hydrogenase/dehydrogenase, beta subunit C-terminal domain [Deltaproteobacteria bacterium]|nr:Coenzyme F420 hydrogenase/dehydrogenase, beta subunit C-terminal domain [Deltaproteobacteria bacterium]
MKTFLDLIEEVQKPGLCHHCGGCVTFCTAVNYGALELDENGMPRMGDKDKCIECGICYMICPETGELDEETRKAVDWDPPMGKAIKTTMARSNDHEIRQRATDGGAVTALLLNLFERGRIDGAIVTRQMDPFHREPILAMSREEIIEAAGFHFDTSQGLKHFSHVYSSFSPSMKQLRLVIQKGLSRVAMVGTPCQIRAFRKIQTLGVVPSDAIKYCLGLFCSGNFTIGRGERKRMAEEYGFRWEDVKRINIKEKLMIHLKSGEIMFIPLNELDFMKRYACRYCSDYSAEYADISFGGIGADEGWTSIVIRSNLGRAIFADASGKTLEVYTPEEKPDFAAEARKKIHMASEMKRNMARYNRRKIGV